MIKTWREEIRSKLFSEPTRWSMGVFSCDVKDKGVYTDGSKLGKKREAGAAALLCEVAPLCNMGIIFAISERLEGEGMTNNIAELKSIINSLIYFNEKNYPMLSDSAYPIFSDSEYAIKAITGVNKVVKNKELIEDAKLLYEWFGGGIRVNHVGAHKGVILNEIADRLARDVVNTS